MRGDTGRRWSFGGEALSVEARYLEPDLPEELQQAYAQTFDRLRRMFRARGCTAEEAADLAQEAAVRAFVHIRRWGVNGTGLDPLLNRIARNLMIDRYRRTTPHIVPLHDAGDIHDPDQDPTEEVARRQRTQAVRSAIKGLPARHQAAITYSLNGLTPEEVGRRMGIGRNAADALLHRARRSLKERLQTVGEGMFGVALGIRIRWDRIARRIGGGSGLEEPSHMVGLQVGIGAVAFAVAAVVGSAAVFAGGRGGGGGTASRAPAVFAMSTATSEEPSSMVDASTEDVASASTSRAVTYSLGPSKATWSSKGFDHETTVPGPRGPEGEPFLKGSGYLHRDDGTVQPKPYDPGVFVSELVCSTLPVACEAPGEGAR